MIKKISCALIVLTILVINILRFCWLDEVPYGFNVDELAGAVTVKCMATQGVDAHLIPHPLFFEQHYGTPKPPVYTYPEILWVKIFGTTADKQRAFTAFFNVLTIIGIFLVGRLLLGTSFGLLAAFLASLSPWCWNLSRIGYESTFCATFTIWGLFFFLRSSKVIDKVWAGILFSFALYVYPPARMQVPLFLVTLLAYQYKIKALSKKVLLAFILALIIPSIPLIHNTLFGNLQKRFGEISIANPDFLKTVGKTNSLNDLTEIFFKNYFSHFSPQYLFITGDPSWEHSTQHAGLLSWVEILGLLCLIGFLIFRFKETKPHLWLLLFLFINILIAIIPASLTHAGLPSNLRTISAFPFSCLLLGYGVWRLTQKWNLTWVLTTLLGIVFAFVFLKQYFTVYPKESMGWFSFWTKEEALRAKTDQDWLEFLVRYKDQDYHARYYLMNYHGESCESSRKIWINIRQALNLPKAY